MRSSFGGHGRLITTSDQFEAEYLEKVRRLLSKGPVNRGSAHAMNDDTTASTHELMYVHEHMWVGPSRAALAAMVSPNLPWADDHFAERVGGHPLNPAPSEAWWPYARQGNAEHKTDEVFSHTYPERFWPRYAGGAEETAGDHPLYGVRFEYGDLADVLDVLRHNAMSRQAYLPVWFPEDLTAAREGQRVPCSMGYHFIWCSECHALDCVYTLRSCDVVRFYRDDMYMAGRLLQWVAHHTSMPAGTLVSQIDNLHCFPGDRGYLESLAPMTPSTKDPRQHYDFGSMM